MAERLLRNRGRSRAMVARLNLKFLQLRLERFLEGRWMPAQPDLSADYAISLTSWSKRLGDLQLTLLLLIDQDVRPSGIHVWLTETDLELIPEFNRRAFEAHGVDFRTCLDYRSHKKWLPMALAVGGKPFVVCDDDIFYPREWFGRLVGEDRQDAYVGCKCHRMIPRPDGHPVPCAEWEKQVYNVPEPSPWLFTTGCGGEILHPNRLPERAFNWNEIRTHALMADDIWLKGIHLEAGIPVYKTKYNFPCLEIPGTDETGLLANHNFSGNDEQIQAVWKHFGIGRTG